MMRTVPGAHTAAFLLLLGAWACRAADADGGPPLEQPPTAQLRAKVGRALEGVRAARQAAAADPAAAAEALADAEDALADVQGYYLPLLQAMEAVGRAYQAHARGQDDAVDPELVDAEDALLGLAGEGDSHLADETREPLELVEDARVALASRKGELSSILRELHRRLRLMVVKGELVLEG